MSVPCPTCLSLDCTSLEDGDLYSIDQSLFPFVLNCPPGFDCSNPTQFSMVCCGQVLSAQFPPNATVDDKQAIITAIVNQCGVRLSFCGDLPNTPNTPIQLFYNRTKQCTVTCPDGSPFVYVVAAGTFAGTDQATVDKQAADFACVQAGLRKVCLGAISKCLCQNALYSATIPHSGGIPPFTWSVFSGALPDGLSLDQTGTISGTPTTGGNFTFTIQVTEPDGSYMRKPYTLSVLSIESSLPDYTVGTPYSHQLAITGGSGDYAVKLDSGAFPDGIVMDVTGLIHGTPTGNNTGTMPLVFDVVDTTCTAIDRSFFVPRVSLAGSSTTTIATVRGYSEYIPSTPPKKYHNLTWSGTSEQVAFTFSSLQKVGDAKYQYLGTGSVDSQGNQLTDYSKNLYTPCPASNFKPLIDSIPNFGVGSLTGYCWSGDPASCPTCSDPPVFQSDVATNSINDSPVDLLGVAGFNTITPTSLTNVSSITEVLSLKNGGVGGVNNVPLSTVNGITAPWIKVTANHNYTSLLDTEYTDAEALANAQVINSNGTTAETFARTTGFVSRWTSVAFVLSFSNLVVGQSYVASVDLFDSSGVLTTKQYGFVASATTKTINDTVPTPAQGHTITVRKPTVAYAP